MLELAHPWMLLCVLLPLPVYFFLPAYKETRDSIKVPFFQRLVELTGKKPERGAVILQRILFQKLWLVISWCLLVLALAKPEWVGEPVVRTLSARDLMIAVDLSGSMETADFTDARGEPVSRLDGVKGVLSEFVQRRQSDRLGLIVFGDGAFLQAPFTDDHGAWLALLAEAQIGMAGQSTRFGDAIGLAIKLFEHRQSQNRVLMVLTDGNDTSSRVPPVEAAKIAKQRGITIYPIAIGDPKTTGEEALDIEVIDKIAEHTGGESYQALNREQLEGVYRRIEALEPEEYQTLSYRPRQSLHHIPLAIVLAGYGVFFAFMTLLSWRKNRARRLAGQSAGDSARV